ncbi:hypothetical protein [Streptomyces cucumeris]|uniref:hypothetical protein n=1 Tax=Streptomyces cucumeris TaxID=2962890 RepID=UPI0020C87817|nr:hypothetical protein [Streptomyces sp. NEAU-Y11]MCP9209576.1 hypothetical protein [Streptomyces sp. NEAU-Y11]
MTKGFARSNGSEHGGHMIKRASDPDVRVKNHFECQDCHIVGNVDVFHVGTRGCPKRPESLDYLAIDGFDGVKSMTTQDRAVASRDHWKSFADRLGMKLQSWILVDNDPEVCARFTFWPHEGGHEDNESHGNYELRFGQKGRYAHEVHAVRA